MGEADAQWLSQLARGIDLEEVWLGLAPHVGALAVPGPWEGCAVAVAARERHQRQKEVRL